MYILKTLLYMENNYISVQNLNYQQKFVFLNYNIKSLFII